MFNGHLKYEPINSLLFNFTVIFNKFPKKTDNPYSKIGIIRFYTCNLKFYHKGTSFVKTYFYTGGGKLPLPCSRLRSAASCRSRVRDCVRRHAAAPVFATAFAYAHSVFPTKTYADRGFPFPTLLASCFRKGSAKSGSYILNNSFIKPLNVFAAFLIPLNIFSRLVRNKR